MLTIYKVAGYAYFYIATAAPEENVKVGEVTASIFASEREDGLFEEMEKSGQLEKTDVKGIYLVKGILDMPFQIVMTNEIEGDEYAAYRVLKAQVDEKDVDNLLERLKMPQTSQHATVCAACLASWRKNTPGWCGVRSRRTRK